MNLSKKYYILTIAFIFALAALFSPAVFAKSQKKKRHTTSVTRKKNNKKKNIRRRTVVSRSSNVRKTQQSIESEELEEIIDSVTISPFDEVDSASIESRREVERTGGVIDDEEILVKGKDGKEEIIEVPEGLVTDSENGDSLDFMERKYLSEDSTSISSEYAPTYEDSVYMDRLKRLPTAIEMPWNPVVQKFIDRYTNRLRHSVSAMLGAQNFYMPIFEQALEVYNIPLELKYLPIIESALKPSATSRVGAAGLWQFMIATGKRYGLKVNSLIDERRDPVKASYAAAHYLNDMYQIFHNWNLVIAAYNCGPGNILKAIQRSGGKHDFWEIYPYLPSETRGYVPAFIAANYIMNYYCQHDIKPMEATLPEETDTIMLFQNLHLKQVSEVLDISMDELRALNPQYRRDIVCGYSEPTDLRLPKEYISKYIEKEKEIQDYDVSDLMKRDQVEVNQSGSYYHSRRSYSRHSSKASRHSKKSKKSSKKSSRSKKKKRRR